jgi:hypothetical protein
VVCRFEQAVECGDRHEDAASNPEGWQFSTSNRSADCLAVHAEDPCGLVEGQGGALGR